MKICKSFEFRIYAMILSMTATGHAVIGTVLAATISSPLLGIPIAIVSHLAADSFPHWDTGTNRKKKSGTRFFIESCVDLSISLILPFFLIQFLNPETSITYLYTMVIAAQLFDWLSAPYTFLRSKAPLFYWATRTQKKFDNRLDKPWGIINQAAILLLLIMFAKLL